ncbi:MAG: Fic family protein [Weeksellaceae bacterium]|nr:Fic family protein [Weeksellaceae bacterium]
MKWHETTYYFEGLENQLERIRQKKTELDELRPIPTYALKSIKESLMLEWTYNSNSIEGNTLSLNETKMVIEEGMTVKGKSLKEHFEAINHQEAIDYITELASIESDLTEKDILNVHELVLNNIEKEIAGRYRTSGVRISGANFVPPNALRVSEYITELIDWVNSCDLDIVIASTLFHHRFVWIHPFFDGNGRTVRLIFNLLLMRAGYPPAIILKNDRKKYYDALNQANKGDCSKLVLLVLQSLERSLNIYLGALNNTYEQYDTIGKIAEDERIPYSQEYLSLLARRGKIDAFKESRDWLTTKKAVWDYIEKRERKRKLN